MSSFVRRLLCTTVAAALFTGSANAQLLSGVSLPAVSVPLPQTLGNVPVAGPVIQNVLSQPGAQQAIQPTLDSVSGLPDGIAESGAPSLLELRRLRLENLVRQNRAVLETDNQDQPVRRGVLLVIDPDTVSLQLAARAGFRVTADSSDPQLGIRSVELAVPPRMNVRSALKLLQKIAPRMQADFDPIFEPAGGSLMPMIGTVASTAGLPSGRSVGMIDGGVASHPSLAGASIEQNGFAGSPKPTGHGTAVASLLVGNQGPFRGAATGAQLYVADVYGGSQAAGSASVIVRALEWLASKQPKVINISLVGPPNRLLERAIQAVQARGIEVAAAAGNDGPAAPPQYPASYAGVISVTAVDARGHALPEAGKPTHLDFAAPGADMAAALPGQGYAKVRGTSFAAPLAAARLMFAGSPQRLAVEARPGSGRVGRGIVCGGCRIDPRAVGAK
jgi:subtilisin family serine protease